MLIVVFDNLVEVGTLMDTMFIYYSLINAHACWGTYAYMHICTKSIQIYFGIFFDFILVLLSFHCSHTVPNFSKFFPIFLAILFTSKACHFDTALLIFASV